VIPIAADFLAAALVGARGGGAIIMDKGSFSGAAGAGAGADIIACGDIGGGPTGAAFSSGSSPGKTHTFRLSS
jgi:hypothetical protein